MELILRSDNETSIAKLIALAQKLDVAIEKRAKNIGENIEREELIKQILDYRATTPSSFGDAAEWERNVRKDRKLPFSK